MEVEVPCLGPRRPASGRVKVAIRPERISVRYSDDAPRQEEGLRLKAALVDNVYLGNASQIFLLPFSKPGIRATLT